MHGDEGFDILLRDGRSLRCYDDGPTDAPALLWHHPTPASGRILAPLAEAASAQGLRLLSCARAGYPGSTRLPARTVADAAADALELADRLELARFAVAGHSGGGSFALGLAALAPERVAAAAVFAAVAPDWGDGWLDGAAAPQALQAARDGLEARARFAETAEFDPAQFVAADWETLKGPWGVLGSDGEAAEQAAGPAGEIDDDLGYAQPWGVELGAVRAAAQLHQGGADRVVPVRHGRRLADLIPAADYREHPGAGHISVLEALPGAFSWIAARL